MAADVYRPDGNRKYPVVLMRTPYKSDIASGSGYFKLIPALENGYAVVVAYVRGRFGSQGTYDLSSPQNIEGADSYDTVEWIAAQSWCDGNIGMVGNPLSVRCSGEPPGKSPHLKAIAPGLAGAPGDVGPETVMPRQSEYCRKSALVLAGDVLDKWMPGVDTAETRRC
jgi:putative CocE/NonD family hydrolase